MTGHIVPPKMRLSLDPTQALQQATLLARQERLREAEALCRKILAAAPSHFEALHLLSELCGRAGRFAEAANFARKALNQRPGSTDALVTLARALAALGRIDEAAGRYRKVLALDPHHLVALNNLGVALIGLRRLEEALAIFAKAITLRPDHAGLFNNRGTALQCLERHEEALASYDQAVALQPDFAEAFNNRGNALYQLNRNREAAASYANAVALKPDYAEARFASCMTELPILYENEAEIAAQRAAYENRLRALCAAGERAGDLAALAQGVGWCQPFYLAYQGRSDRDLQALYGTLVCRIMAERFPPATPAPPPRAGETVRVGIVSGFFRDHSNWKIPIKGWLSQLDRRRFRVFGYFTGEREDAETAAAAALCDRFVRGPRSLARWRAEIMGDAPHVLIYPEVGMDRVAVMLAAQRIAGVQCNSWGHPDTSGLPTLDYYLSSELMEPPDGQDHYTERLVRLPNLSVYCEPVDPPRSRITRQDLGLRPAATVYWCGQSLFKYLPQFDALFPRIARAAGDCQFVFIHFQGDAHVTEIFRRRLAQAFADVGLSSNDYCVFLPRLAPRAFVAAVGQCDVFLDSIGWSGCNSTLESLFHDLPIVTLPGPLMRGRHSMAILRMMGVTETIAEGIDDYVALAARAALDVPWRQTISRKIAKHKHLVYRDRDCIAALEAFLIEAAEHGQGAQDQERGKGRAAANPSRSGRNSASLGRQRPTEL